MLLCLHLPAFVLEGEQGFCIACRGDCVNQHFAISGLQGVVGLFKAVIVCDAVYSYLIFTRQCAGCSTRAAELGTVYALACNQAGGGKFCAVKDKGFTLVMGLVVGSYRELGFVDHAGGVVGVAYGVVAAVVAVIDGDAGYSDGFA